LDLIGSGSFDISQLAKFTGFSGSRFIGLEGDHVFAASSETKCRWLAVIATTYE
jgi:hypothetical protein